MYLNPLGPPQTSEYVSNPLRPPHAVIICSHYPPRDTQALIHARSLAVVRSTKDRASIIIIMLFSCIEMAVTRKTEKKLEEMYNKINKEDLPHDTIDRGLMIDVMNKVLILADWYFDTYCSDFNKARQIYANNLLWYRIKTVKSTTNQRLGILYCQY